jgi:hypothetical protein
MFNPSSTPFLAVPGLTKQSFFAVQADGKVGTGSWSFPGGAAFRNVLDDGSGKVGIGTSSPLYKFDLRTPQSLTSQMHISSTDNDTGGYLTSANAGNLFMSGGAAWNGSWVAKNTSAYLYGGGPAGVRFFFDTGLTVGNTYSPTTRLFIAPNGNVGIGLSTPATHLLQLSGGAYSDGTTWQPASSIRWKENITPLTNSLEVLRQLHPVSFNYKKTPGKTTMGFIAEEVGKVLPTVVDWDQNAAGYAEGYDHLAILALAVETIKQLIERIEKVERQIAAS